MLGESKAGGRCVPEAVEAPGPGRGAPTRASRLLYVTFKDFAAAELSLCGGNS